MNTTAAENNYDGPLVRFLDRAVPVLSWVAIWCAILYFGGGFIVVKMGW